MTDDSRFGPVGSEAIMVRARMAAWQCCAAVSLGGHPKLRSLFMVWVRPGSRYGGTGGTCTVARLAVGASGRTCPGGRLMRLLHIDPLLLRAFGALESRLGRKAANCALPGGVAPITPAALCVIPLRRAQGHPSAAVAQW